MSEKEITAKVRELRELMAMADELNAEITAIQDTIKGFMGEREELKAGEYKIRYNTVKSSRFDTTAFKATHQELYNQYAKQTVTRRFSVA
jgi:predicted phage-related endonuclease